MRQALDELSLLYPAAHPRCKARVPAAFVASTRKHLSFLWVQCLLTTVSCCFPPSASLGSSSRQWRNLPQNVMSTSCYRRTAAAKGLRSSQPWAAARGSWRRSSTKDHCPIYPWELPAAPPRPRHPPHSPTPSPLGSRDSTSAPPGPPHSQRDMLHA